MKKIKLIAVVLLTIILYSSSYSQYYYYSDNRQIPLSFDSTQILILFDEDWTYDIANFAADYQRIDSVNDYPSFEQFHITYINNANNLEEFFDTLLVDVRVDLVNPYYLNSFDSSKLVGRTICCKFGDEVSIAFIDSLNAANGVEIEYANEYASNLFLLSVTDSATQSVLEISNMYYELDETEFCHPNFFGGYEWNGYQIYDHYWEEQWAMHRIFEVTPSSPDSLDHKAYEITRGDSSIIIAVVDQGLNVHEDLPENRLVTGYDFAGMDDDPTPCGIAGRGYHGEAVAGIIGAEHNRNPDSLDNPNTGIYGVAPLCKFMPVKIGTGFEIESCEHIPDDWIIECSNNCVGGFFAPEEHMAAGIEWAWAHGADIISCSWGGTSPSDRIWFAISQASIVGRDGKGCGIFFSSGNRPYYEEYYPAMYPEVISVASLHPDDSLWDYCTTAKVDVVAPSGPLGGAGEHTIWTLDLMDENDSTGYNTYYNDLGCGEPDDDDYMCKFGGTSGAQPMAAGVAALVLSRRPDLTHEELHDVIRNSADPNLYITITDPPDEKYGYGMVHPLRALLSVMRGDLNNDGVIDVLDITYYIQALYKAGPPPQPDKCVGDVNCDGLFNVLDITYLITFLYKNGPEPPICFIYEYESYPEWW